MNKQDLKLFKFQARDFSQDCPLKNTNLEEIKTLPTGWASGGWMIVVTDGNNYKATSLQRFRNHHNYDIMRFWESAQIMCNGFEWYKNRKEEIYRNSLNDPYGKII